MLHFSQDLRYALRLSLKNPGFTLIALLALTIGIGANAAIFSVVNTIVLKPLRFKEPDRLMVLLDRNVRSGNTGPISAANYYDIRRAARSFEDIGAAEAWSAALTGQGTPEQVPGLRMTANMFRLLRAQPELGRVFQENEEEPGRDRVIVLSHGLWKRRFGGDPNVIGSTIFVRGEPYELAGVMPAGFAFPPFWASKAEAWVPLAFTPERKATRRASTLRLFGRLQPGVDRQQAQAEASAIAARLASEYPNSNTDSGLAVTPLHEMTVGKLKPVMMTLLGAVGFVLLIACANVANLLLTRSIARRKEISVRLAIGAGRGRIVRQLLTEAILLSLFGGILGLVFAYWSVDAIQAGFRNSPSFTSLPRLDELHLDSSVLLFTVGISVLTGLFFGLAPAVQAVRPQLSAALRETARGLHGRSGSARLRSGLVTAQVALTFMLLFGAGLLVRSFHTLSSLDPGFRADNVLTTVLNPAGTSIGLGEKQVQFYQTVIANVAALPGVKSAAAVNHLPLAGDVWGTNFLVEGRPVPAPGERFNAVYRVVSPGYFNTIGIAIKKGREFAASDVKGTEPMVVINETMAQRYWPGQNALGQRIKLGASEPWLTISGVSTNVKQRDWAEESGAELYLPYLQRPEHFNSPWSSSMTLVIRTASDPIGLIKPVQSAVWSIDRNIPLTDSRTLDDVISDAIRQPRLFAVLLGIFAAAAVLLAGIGIYGVVAHSVAQRTAEMGIRLALGASAPALLFMITSSALKFALAGSLLGIAGALALSRAMASILYGVQPTDVLTFCGVTVLLLAVTSLASYLPARRVTRIDPASALRYE